MSNIKKITSLLFVFVLCVCLIPANIALATDESTGTIYYVDGQVGNDSNDGTEQRPVKTLNRALELVQDGDIIYVLKSAMIEDVASNDAPFVIDKKIVIRGDSGSLPTITVQSGGIILGADVTFSDIKLGTGGFLRPGVAVNGHKLTLTNVHEDPTLRPLQIYGGTFYDYSDLGAGKGNDYGASYRGEKSVIQIAGGSYDAIYAGSTNGSLSWPVTIDVAKANGLTMDGIYVGSTMKNPNNASTAGEIPTLDGTIVLSGTVDISISDNAAVKVVDGVAGSHQVSLNVSGTGTYSLTVKNVDALTVNSGTCALSGNSIFGQKGNKPDITLLGSGVNKATLDLSECDYTDTKTVSVKNFTGSKYGILVLDSQSTLAVEGTLTGGPTELRTGGGMPWSSDEYPGYSGWMEYATTYIFGGSGDGTFVIANPYPTQDDMDFTENSSVRNGWTTIGDSYLEAPELVDFTPASQSVTYDTANTSVAGIGGVNIEVETEYTELTLDNYLDDLSYVPFEYTITYTDVSGSVTEYKKQSSTLTEDSYYLCNYKASTEANESSQILMKLEPVGSSINICKGDGEIKVGEYQIALTATTTSGTVTKEFILTVLNEEENPGETPGGEPEDNPGETPGEKPEDNPGEIPGDDPEDNSGETPEDTPQEAPAVNVFYRTHIQSFGWEGNADDIKTWKTNGAMSGTSGKAKRLEGINIVVNSADLGKGVDLGIQYTTHCQSYGWLPWSADGEMNGTEGEAKRLEAIKIQLTGADKDTYDVYYRVHAQSYGWLGWAKNGEPSGTAGFAKRLEGIQIVVVKKDESFNQEMEGITSAKTEAYIAKKGSSPIVNYEPTNNTTPVIPGADTPNVAYRTHVQSFGWQVWKYNGQMSGTEGKAKRLEGININLTNKPYDGDIVYTTHVQTYGWKDGKPEDTTRNSWKKNGQMSGTSGEAKRLEAICIDLTGEMAQHYDIYYRVHAQSFGWLHWAKNGEPAGTEGYAKRLEGIEIVLVPKGEAAPGETTRPYVLREED